MSGGVEAYVKADKLKVKVNRTDATREHNHGP